MSLLPLNGLYFSNHVLKLKHEIVNIRAMLVSLIRPGFIVQKINQDKRHHRYRLKTNWINKELVHLKNKSLPFQNKSLDTIIILFRHILVF